MLIQGACSIQKLIVTTLRTFFALAFLTIAAPSHAGLISISFTAETSPDDNSITQQTHGVFVLDTSIPFIVGAGFQDGLIRSAFFENDDLTIVGDIDDPFTSVVADNVNGFGGVINLIASYPDDSGIFVLELLSSDLFEGDSVFDLLKPGLSLDDLVPYDADADLTTQFIYIDNSFSSGRLTSLEVMVATGPSIISLTGAGIILFILLTWRKTLSGNQ